MAPGRGGRRWATARRARLSRLVVLATAVLVAEAIASILDVAPAGARAVPAVSWSIQRVLPAASDPNSFISCPTVLDCWVSGGDNFVATTDGGRRWRAQRLPSGIGRVSSISCPTATRCFAVGIGNDGTQVIATADGGRHWTTQTLPSGTEGVYEISCGSATSCMATTFVDEGNGWGLVRTIDGGAVWTPVTTPVAGGDAEISCPTRSACWVASQIPNPAYPGTIVEVTGTGSAATPPPAGNFYGISCPDDSHCSTVGRLLGPVGTEQEIAMVRTSDGGATWKSTALPATMTEPLTIACATASDCWVGGIPGVVATTDGGTTWKSEAVPGKVFSVQNISCPRPTACFAVGYTTDVSDTVILFRR